MCLRGFAHAGERRLPERRHLDEGNTTITKLTRGFLWGREGREGREGQVGQVGPVGRAGHESQEFMTSDPVATPPATVSVSSMPKA